MAAANVAQPDDKGSAEQAATVIITVTGKVTH